VGLEKELIKNDNFGRKSGVITLRMDKEDGAQHQAQYSQRL
jgi:hypothetical protein